MDLSQPLSYLADQLNNYIYKPEVDETTAQSKFDIAKDLGDEVTKSFMRQYVLPRDEEKPFLRVSSLGKPAVLQALHLLGLEKQGELSTKSRHIFFTGDVFESYVIAYMKLMDWSVQRQQEEVEFLGVKGHIDGVMSIPDIGSCVLEFKTMSQNYFASFTKEVNDDRGYITQLAIYSHCLGLPACWVVINKGTHEVRVIAPAQDDLDAALHRAERIIPKLLQVKGLEDVVTLFKAPPPQEELYRGKPTGLYVVPNSMKYSTFRHAFYDLVQAKSKGGSYKEYIESVATPEVALSRLERMLVTEVDELEALLEEETVAV